MRKLHYIRSLQQQPREQELSCEGLDRVQEIRIEYTLQYLGYLWQYDRDYLCRERTDEVDSHRVGEVTDHYSYIFFRTRQEYVYNQC